MLPAEESWTTLCQQCWNHKECMFTEGNCDNLIFRRQLFTFFYDAHWQPVNDISTLCHWFHWSCDIEFFSHRIRKSALKKWQHTCALKRRHSTYSVQSIDCIVKLEKVYHHHMWLLQSCIITWLDFKWYMIYAQHMIKIDWKRRTYVHVYFFIIYITYWF